MDWPYPPSVIGQMLSVEREGTLSARERLRIDKNQPRLGIPFSPLFIHDLMNYMKQTSSSYIDEIYQNDSFNQEPMISFRLCLVEIRAY